MIRFLVYPTFLTCRLLDTDYAPRQRRRQRCRDRNAGKPGEIVTRHSTDPGTMIAIPQLRRLVALALAAPMSLIAGSIGAGRAALVTTEQALEVLVRAARRRPVS
jgi:hypothetical protein